MLSLCEPGDWRLLQFFLILFICEMGNNFIYLILLRKLKVITDREVLSTLPGNHKCAIIDNWFVISDICFPSHKGRFSLIIVYELYSCVLQPYTRAYVYAEKKRENALCFYP